MKNRYPDGLERDAQGNIKPDPNLPTYEARMAERYKATKAQEAAERAERIANGGRFTDPFGIERDADGRPLAVTDRERAERQEIERELAENNV